MDRERLLAEFAKDMDRRGPLCLPRYPSDNASCLADWQICDRLFLPPGDPRRLVIHPYCPTTKEPGRPGWGLSSAGYDLRLGRTFKIFSNLSATVLDVRKFDESCLIAHEGDWCIIPPNSFVLGQSVEYIEMPEDVIALALGKSTNVRCAVGSALTPLEPGWRGYLTLELPNHAPLPLRIHAGDGICQLVFFQLGGPASVPYNKKASAMYQDQEGLRVPSV